MMSLEEFKRRLHNYGMWHEAAGEQWQHNRAAAERHLAEATEIHNKLVEAYGHLRVELRCAADEAHAFGCHTATAFEDCRATSCTERRELLQK